uniref:Uncharacterized protein n=1 Tax=Acrobeloides nanus TaxID=290746 RepID=A0A914DAZ5_9BILA
MAAFRLDTGLQTLRNLFHYVSQHCKRNFFPSFQYNRLQGLQTSVGRSTGLSLQVFPDAEVHTPHRSLKSLKAALLKAWEEIPLTMLRDIVEKVPERLKACIKAKGGYFDI